MRPRRSLLALVRPDRAFDGWTPDRRLAFGVIVGLCILNAAALSVTAGTVTDQVSGTVSVPNPAHPPDWVCDSNHSQYWDCDAPATVERSLSVAANAGASSGLLWAFLAPFLACLTTACLAGVFAQPGAETDDAVDATFGSAFGVAALAMAPAAIRYAARPFLVRRSLADWTYPGTLAGVRHAAALATTPTGTLALAIGILTGLWTAAIVYVGLAVARDVPRYAAAIAAGVPFAVLALRYVVGPTTLPGDITGPAVVLLLVGVVGTLQAEGLARLRAFFDLIGYRGRVDPRPWLLALRRLVAAGFLSLAFAVLTLRFV